MYSSSIYRYDRLWSSLRSLILCTCGSRRVVLPQKCLNRTSSLPTPTRHEQDSISAVGRLVEHGLPLQLRVPCKYLLPQSWFRAVTLAPPNKIYQSPGTCVCFQIGLAFAEPSFCRLLQSKIQPFLLETGDSEMYSDFIRPFPCGGNDFFLSSNLTGLFWARFNAARHSWSLHIPSS